MKTLIAAAAFVALWSLAAEAAPPRQGEDPIDWCVGGNGSFVDQPAGSAIQACCTAEGCVICDANWANCHFEPSLRGAAAGGAGVSGPGSFAPSSPAQSEPVSPSLLQTR